MSLINVSLNLVAYADAMKNVNPAVKFTDLKWSMLGLPTASPQMIPIALSPGQSQLIASSTRTISYTGGTSFQVFPVPTTSSARLIGAFVARTARNAGDGTTQWQITKTNTLIQVLWTGTGTAPDFTTMSPGDGITITTPFNVFNQGDFVITNKGSNFVEFVNPLGVTETVIGQMDIYTSGPVQAGDTLDISSGVFSYPNQGMFTITRVTDQYVEFSNSSAIPETVSGIAAGGVVIYPNANKWMLLAVDQKVIVKFNGDTGTGVEVDPPVVGDLQNNPGILLKRGKVFQLNILNPGLVVASGFVFLSE